MPETYWYAYDKTGSPSAPFFEEREGAVEDAGDDELVRPVSAEVLEPSDFEASVQDALPDADDGPEPYAELGHDELKAEAEERGIADETDLRSKDAVIEALRQYDENE